MNPSASDIRQAHPSNGYVAYHAPRFASTLSIIQEYCPKPASVLDIGSSDLTALLASQFNSRVDTLGFEADGETRTGQHYHFDLNQAQHPDKWRTDLPAYSLIVMAEVLEHLYTAPSLVLKFLHTLLDDKGLLLIQTPNAAVLHKRLLLLTGRNPYEPIRENNRNPGHFREYTLKELRKIVSSAGFEWVSHQYGNYFDYRFVDHAEGRYAPRGYLAMVNWVYRIMPGSLRPGITLLLRKQA